MAPKVYFSYSHDSIEHKEWVLGLAKKLRENGIDAQLDQWDVKLGEDFTYFMEQINTGDFTLIVCTEKYVNKANNRRGGVGYESMILACDISTDINTDKFIPIMRGNATKTIPKYMGAKKYTDFSDDNQFESSFEELIKRLHGIDEKPPLGKNPFETKQIVQIELDEMNKIDKTILSKKMDEFIALVLDGQSVNIGISSQKYLAYYDSLDIGEVKNIYKSYINSNNDKLKKYEVIINDFLPYIIINKLYTIDKIKMIATGLVERICKDGNLRDMHKIDLFTKDKKFGCSIFINKEQKKKLHEKVSNELGFMDSYHIPSGFDMYDLPGTLHYSDAIPSILDEMFYRKLPIEDIMKYKTLQIGTG